MVPELSCNRSAVVRARKQHSSVVAYFVKLHEPLPQPVHLLTVDCLVSAPAFQPRRHAHEQRRLLPVDIQFEPEAMLSRIADGWLPILASV